MTARDVIALIPRKTETVLASGTLCVVHVVIGTDTADAILDALDKAGYAVVPKKQTAAFLADNVSDEMVRASMGAMSEALSLPADLDPAHIHLACIVAALRQAAGGGE